MEAQDDDQRMRLSGEFHLALAECAGNPILTEFLGELVSRCYLILATYQRRDFQNCPQNDHVGIVDLLERGDADGAYEALLGHFGHIEDELDLNEVDPTKRKLKDIFLQSNHVPAE